MTTPSMYLAAVMVHTSRTYTLRVGDQVEIGTLAQYLSQQEAYVSAGTLEIARAVETSARLHDLDLRPGDRLVIFSQPATPLRPPDSIRPGDKTLTFSRGDYVLRSYGKRGLLVGKPDTNNYHALPDVDIRNFIVPGMLEYVSRGCLWLTFDSAQQIWYATRMGETRILIDEFELGSDKIALPESCTLNFYRSFDNPRDSDPIGNMHIEIQDVREASDIVSLPEGHYPVRVQIGTERGLQTLRASQNVPIGQIVTSLALYNHVALTETMRVYLMRLLPPATLVQNLRLMDDEFFYVGLRLGFANNLLVLRDSHGQHIHEVESSHDDQTFMIGSSGLTAFPSIGLDIDLAEAVGTHRPGKEAAISMRQGYIDYRTSESSWYIRQTEDTRVPMFINNIRVGMAPTRILSGDVLTIGPGMNDYYVRLEIEITSRLD